MLQAMTKTQEPMGEVVRGNLKRFREDAGYTQTAAAEASGVSIDNLRRYESGTTENVPFTVVAQLSKIYGHPIEDFTKVNPPPIKREELPVFFLRTRPGVDIDPDIASHLQIEIDKANRELRSRKKR